MSRYIRELLRYWELRWKLSKQSTPEERMTVRQAHSDKYKAK